ncbi:hypothetical protein [Nitriliruptor alkaliphilus]|uniref:hypothetical protein n=1 Tax=Nitriliruptor alkaliphilus TaxID=427918 RepID=UPI0006976050|nr:hypothetical protein [Nitriliruptor alkaliphilus]
MPIEDVADLVARWQRARSPGERARVAATGARTLRGLSIAERRVLAQGLAERGAPEAAAQLQRYGAGVLTSRQMTELAAALRSVEPAQLEGLAASLADPAERHRLARAAVGSVIDGGPPPPTGPPLAGPDPAPPPAPTGEAVPLPPPQHTPDAPDDLDGWPDLADGGTEAADADTDAAETDAADADGAEGAEGAEGADEWVDLASTPATPDPAATIPAATTFDPAAALADIDRAGSVQARLAAARSLAGTPLTSDSFTAVLLRLPDGWQRRTIARRLLEAGGVTDVDTEQVLTCFERHGDRTAVGHVLVDRDLAHVETVTDHLAPGAAARVRRRSRGAA